MGKVWKSKELSRSLCMSPDAHSYHPPRRRQRFKCKAHDSRVLLLLSVTVMVLKVSKKCNKSPTWLHIELKNKTKSFSEEVGSAQARSSRWDCRTSELNLWRKLYLKGLEINNQLISCRVKREEIIGEKNTNRLQQNLIHFFLPFYKLQV